MIKVDAGMRIGYETRLLAGVLRVWLLPLPPGAVRSLSRFSRLESLSLGHSHLPILPVASTMCQLAALTSLELMGESLGPRLMAAIIQLSRLRSLDLWSTAVLPDVHQLSVLSSLTRLTLEGGSTWDDAATPMRLPPANAFQGLARLDATGYAYEASSGGGGRDGMHAAEGLTISTAAVPLLCALCQVDLLVQARY